MESDQAFAIILFSLQMQVLKIRFVELLIEPSHLILVMFLCSETVTSLAKVHVTKRWKILRSQSKLIVRKEHTTIAFNCFKVDDCFVYRYHNQNQN